MPHPFISTTSSLRAEHLEFCDSALDFAKLRQQQCAMAASIVHTDQLNLQGLSMVGGLGIHWKDDSRGFAALAVVSWPALSLVHTETSPVVTQIT